jgi:hypothetical protein
MIRFFEGESWGLISILYISRSNLLRARFYSAV